MHKSESISSIAPALVKALAEITDVGKSQTATVKSERTGKEFTYDYATLKDVMAIIRPIFKTHGLAMLQFTRGTDKAIEVETMAIHESGEWISDTLTLSLESVGARGAGSTITYARRYGAQAFVAMASNDDDAAAAAAAQESSAGRIWDGQVADWIAAIETADTKEEAKGHYNSCVAKAKEREDLHAANRVKAALLKRFPVESRVAA